MVKCKYCGNDFKAPGMTNHLKTCYVKRCLTCLDCGRKFRNEREINMHKFTCLGGLS